MISDTWIVLKIPQILFTMGICNFFKYLTYVFDHTLTSLYMFFRSDRILLYTSLLFLSHIKGAPTLHFTHYLCVGIILFNVGWYNSASSIQFFGKPDFHLSCVFCLLCLCYHYLYTCPVLCNFALNLQKLS